MKQRAPREEDFVVLQKEKFQFRCAQIHQSVWLLVLAQIEMPRQAIKTHGTQSELIWLHSRPIGGGTPQRGPAERQKG